MSAVITETVMERNEAMRTRSRRRRWITEVSWKYLLAIVIVGYAVFPLVYVLSASLASSGTLTGSTELFRSISSANYKALNTTMFWTWAGNSLVIGTVTAIGSVLMGAAAAYAFSRYRFYGRRGSLTGLLVIQMFPQMLAFISIFLLLIALGNVIPALGLDSKLGLVAVYLGGALGTNTFLMYGFFNSVPRELDEPPRSTVRRMRRSTGGSSCVS